MLLSRDQILSSKDIETKEVDAHEWGSAGDVVLVRALTLKEGNEWRKSMLTKVVTRDKTGKTSTEFVWDQEKAELANAAMLSIAMIDEKGNRQFTAADIDALSGKSIAPIARIVKVVMDISGLSKDATDDALPNSEPSPSDSTFIN